MFPVPTHVNRDRKKGTRQVDHTWIKTRAQLARMGTLKRGDLDGVEPPGWFRLQCDGCSIPTRAGKLFLRAERFAWPCENHDFMYYLAALQWTPGSPQWQGARLRADARLKENIRLVAKNKFFGFMYSRIYFRGVRIGGRKAMRKPEKNPETDKLAVPPTAETREQLKTYLDQPLTALAERQFAEWERVA